jgi:hypothetical protein
MTALRGSCLCGEVRFQIAGTLMRASHCHCRQCQKAHGAPFRTRARVAAADFRFLAGEELVSFYESTPGTHPGFCAGSARHRRSRRHDRSSSAVPLLRRPHDHCRGLYARRRTARPALRRWDPDLIR